METSGVLWDIEPHTEAKHDILRRYLGAWFPIMAYLVGAGGRLVYVDGFAGPGRYRGGQEGSPVIAVNALIQHKLWSSRLQSRNYTFLFIEADQRRAESLRHLLQGLNTPSNISWYVEVGLFETMLTNLLDDLEKERGHLAPTFLFVDPFGPTGFPMTLVNRLLRYPKSEVLITLNLRALNQWWLPQEHRYAEVDNIFGSETWRSCLSIAEPREKEACLRSAYRSELGGEASLFLRDFRMVNEHNQTAYWLVYGTHSPRGLAVMKDAMRAVDPSGSFSYSDMTNPDQPFLFGSQFDEMHGQELAHLLKSQYAGQTIEKRALEEFVGGHENYVRPHLTKALELLVAQGSVTPSSKRRGRGWPVDASFTFPPLPSQ